jgi:crossover junction endodeoxyribonuclease RuvC
MTPPNSTPVRVLGIDPGSRITGWAVLEIVGKTACRLESGVVKVGDGDFTQRLVGIQAGLDEVIKRWAPDFGAIERVFVSKNIDSALKLAHARGVALCAMGAAELSVQEYSAREIKLNIVGSGAAAKEQVQHMVKVILSIDEKLSLDESDALAIALCHAHHIQMGPLALEKQKMMGAGRKRGGSSYSGWR